MLHWISNAEIDAVVNGINSSQDLAFSFISRYLVIDEADRMVEKGHFQELHHILERLNASPARRQTFVFSATLTLVHGPPSRLKSMKTLVCNLIISL